MPLPLPAPNADSAARSLRVRNPTLADQFLYYNVGRASLIGNLRGGPDELHPEGGRGDGEFAQCLGPEVAAIADWLVEQASSSTTRSRRSAAGTVPIEGRADEQAAQDVYGKGGQRECGLASGPAGRQLQIHQGPGGSKTWG